MSAPAGHPDNIENGPVQQCIKYQFFAMVAAEAKPERANQLSDQIRLGTYTETSVDHLLFAIWRRY